ncbi:hypothetical protein HYX01_02150 [Candidatus Woesearchaeota archaeon]|nr:hypothetical protein [Candidatus Woesearchaeota archaeon]
MRKAQGINAAVLVAVIAGLIALYILFLPETEREMLLENKSIKKTIDEKEDKNVLLKVFPGRIDVAKSIEDKSIPNIFLFEMTNAQEIEKINPLVARNAWFDKKEKSVSFNVNDLENTDNVILSFKAKKHDGILAIKLNNELIYENEINSETVAPVRLKKSLLMKENTLVFSVSSVGYKFWKTNEYSLEDIKIIGDITDRSKQESRNIFTLTGAELANIESAALRFVPYCRNVDEVGRLQVLVNNREVFLGVPVCDDPYEQQVPVSVLNAGENKVIFKTSKGSYSVEQIEFKFREKEVKTNVHFFEVNRTQKAKDIILIIEFVDDRQNKRADLSINNRLSEIDQEKNIFSKNINDFVKEGNNFIEIKPRTKLDIVEIRVESREK